MKTIEQASLENSKLHYCWAFGEDLHQEADIDFRAGFEFAQKWIDPEIELPAIGETFLAKLSTPRNYDGHGESIYLLYIRSSKFDKECLSFLKSQGVIGWRRIEIE